MNGSLPGRFWSRLPVVLRSILAGGLAAAAGSLPWAFLVTANTRHWPAVPWAVVPAALYLWVYWKYVTGWGPPASSSASRRLMCRANPLPPDAWPMAIVSGIVGLTAVELLQSITSRLVLLPQQREIDPSQFPVVTVALWVIMSAIVAGVAEEASFRGYIQGPIERRHGPVVAVLVTGSLFGFAHFSHPEVGLILMPYYLLVAAVYGATAYFTNSIYPGLVLHAGGNMLGTLNLLTRGASEWQASPPSVPLVWETGTDISFWMTIAGFIAALAGAIAAFASLRRIVRSDARFPAAP